MITWRVLVIALAVLLGDGYAEAQRPQRTAQGTLLLALDGAYNALAHDLWILGMLELHVEQSFGAPPRSAPRPITDNLLFELMKLKGSFSDRSQGFSSLAKVLAAIPDHSVWALATVATAQDIIVKAQETIDAYRRVHGAPSDRSLRLDARARNCGLHRDLHGLLDAYPRRLVTMGELSQGAFEKWAQEKAAAIAMLGDFADALCGPPSWAGAQSSKPSPEQPSAIREPSAIGSGVVVSSRGHVLTNHHVVKDCAEVRTRVAGGPARRTEILARDPQNDLAVLQGAHPNVTAAAFREGRPILQGEPVIAVGFPLQGLLSSAPHVTVGTISALAGVGDDTRFLQITAPVQPGNSGGPLLDRSGHLLGVIVAKLDALKVAEATGDVPQNVNFALRASVVRAFLDAHGIEFKLGQGMTALSTEEIAERAKRFTVEVECAR